MLGEKQFPQWTWDNHHHAMVVDFIQNETQCVQLVKPIINLPTIWDCLLHPFWVIFGIVYTWVYHTICIDNSPDVFLFSSPLYQAPRLIHVPSTFRYAASTKVLGNLDSLLSGELSKLEIRGWHLLLLLCQM